MATTHDSSCHQFPGMLEDDNAKRNLLSGEELDHVFNLVAGAAANVLEAAGDRSRHERLPPTRDTARHRFSVSSSRVPSISESFGTHAVAKLAAEMVKIASGNRALEGFFFYVNAKGLKTSTSVHLTSPSPLACTYLKTALDVDVLSNPDSAEVCYLDVALELSPPVLRPCVALWRWYELSCALGELVGGMETAGGSWKYVHLHSSLGPIGGIGGPTTSWAQKMLHVHRVSAYTNAKLMHIAFAQKDATEVHLPSTVLKTI